MLTLVGALAFVEVLLRARLATVLRELLQITERVRRVVGSPRISDHWKERVLPAYAGQLLRRSLHIALALPLAALPLLALVGLSAWRGWEPPLHAFLLSTWGIALGTVASIAYAGVRGR